MFLLICRCRSNYMGTKFTLYDTAEDPPSSSSPPEAVARTGARSKTRRKKEELASIIYVSRPIGIGGDLAPSLEGRKKLCKNMVHDTSMALSSLEKPLFKKKFLDDTFFHSVRTFARIQQHYFSKYWGTDALAVPHLKFWGTVPQSSLSLRPFIGLI